MKWSDKARPLATTPVRTCSSSYSGQVNSQLS